MRYWTECIGFFRQYRRRFRDTGSVLPSSRFLARELASELARPRGPARILEVGPGTGAVTRAILVQLRPDDQLDLVELNDEFVALLRRRFEEEETFRRHRSQVRILHQPVETLEGESQYDFVISGLPMNNFPVALVRQIFRVFRRLLKPGGSLSYFEYLGVRPVKRAFVGRAERRRLWGVGRVVGKYIRTGQFRCRRVWPNVPPAMVRHLHLK
jgi:phospholipid N-methyltransferase